jgi:hypothetical protein
MPKQAPIEARESTMIDNATMDISRHHHFPLNSLVIPVVKFCCILMSLFWQ